MIYLQTSCWSLAQRSRQNIRALPSLANKHATLFFTISWLALEADLHKGVACKHVVQSQSRQMPLLFDSAVAPVVTGQHTGFGQNTVGPTIMGAAPGQKGACYHGYVSLSAGLAEQQAGASRIPMGALACLGQWDTLHVSCERAHAHSHRAL